MSCETLKTCGPWLQSNGCRRRAMSLVEVMVSITLVAILLVTITMLAVRLRQWDRRVREHVLNGDQLANLAETMRADIRSAASVALQTKKIIVISGGVKPDIRYELQSDDCRRIVKMPGETSGNVETFAIGPGDSWKLEPGPPGRQPAYAITIIPIDSEKVLNRSIPLLVYAALGTDLP
jgi:type II secretory pathway pseudopilin PulG